MTITTFRPKLGVSGPANPAKTKLTLKRSSLTADSYPASVDYYGDGTKWPMYGNDMLGDCTIASPGHIIGSTSMYANGVEKTITHANIIKAYVANTEPPYDPTTGKNDNGCDMGTVLAYWRNTGIGVHKCTAYAALEGFPTDNGTDDDGLAFLKAAINTFDAVTITVNLPENTYNGPYGPGEPWRNPSSTKSAGLHEVCLVGYRENGDFVCVTWGTTQVLGAGWLKENIREAFAIITPEWLTAKGTTLHGDTLSDLGADMKSLTGTDPFATEKPKRDADKKTEEK